MGSVIRQRGLLRRFVSGKFLAAVVLWAPQGGATVPSPTDSIEVARTWFKEGERESAERLLRRLLPRLEETYGAASAGLGKALDVLVTILRRTGRSHVDETRTLARRALAVKAEVFGEDHLEYAASLLNLGIIQVRSREFAASESTFMQVRAIREAALPAGHPDIVYIIAALGNVRNAAGDVAGAIKYYRESIDLAETQGDPTSSDANLARVNLSQALVSTGQYAEARSLLDGLVAALERANSGILGEALHQRALLAMYTGDHRGSLPLYRRALEIAERRGGPSAPTVVQIRNNMAKALIYLEQFTEARDALDRQLELLEPAGPSRSLALAYAQLARMHCDMKDYGEELHWQERSLEMMKSIYPPDHPRVAEATFLTGVAYAHNGLWEAEKEAIEDAQTILLERNGPTDPWQTYAFSYLAKSARARGDNAEARRLLNDATAQHLKIVGEDTPRVAEILVQLGTLDRDESRVEDACRHFARALAIVQQRFGTDHPRAAEIRVELARAQLAAGRPAEALENALAAHRILTATRITLRVLPHRQALRFAGKLTRCLDMLLTLARGETAAEIWNAVIASRALVLDEMAARNRSITATDPEHQQRIDAYLLACTRMANLYVRGSDEDDPEDYQALLEDARREMEAAERRLPSGDRREATSSHIPDLAMIRATLAPRQALVALSRYTEPGAMPHYRAFLLSDPASEAATLELGEAATIDALITAWRTEASLGTLRTDRSADESQRACDRAGRALRAAIWDPLAAHLGSAETVFLVPDGQLHLINWSALVFDDGRYLIEAGACLRLLTTEREILRHSEPLIPTEVCAPIA